MPPLSLAADICHQQPPLLPIDTAPAAGVLTGRAQATSSECVTVNGKTLVAPTSMYLKWLATYTVPYLIDPGDASPTPQLASRDKRCEIGAVVAWWALKEWVLHQVGKGCAELRPPPCFVPTDCTACAPLDLHGCWHQTLFH